MTIRKCRHDDTPQSTLEVFYISPVDGFNHCLWVCKCSVCGKNTEPSLTSGEAIERGVMGWLA